MWGWACLQSFSLLISPQDFSFPLGHLLKQSTIPSWRVLSYPSTVPHFIDSISYILAADTSIKPVIPTSLVSFSRSTVRLWAMGTGGKVWMAGVRWTSSTIRRTNRRSLPLSTTLRIAVGMDFRRELGTCL